MGEGAVHFAPAKLFGFKRDEEGKSELSQAIHKLTLYVLESQEFMIGVYALRIALDKVEKAPNADVSAKDAKDFVRSCMAILTRLISTVDPKPD